MTGSDTTPTTTAREILARLSLHAHLVRRLSLRWILGTAGIVSAAILFLITAFALGAMALHMLEIKDKADDAVAILRESGLLVQTINNMNATSRTYLNLRDGSILAEREKSKLAIAYRFDHLRRHVAAYPELGAEVAEADRLNARQNDLFDQMIAIAGPPGTAVVEGEAERFLNTKAINAQFSLLRDWATQNFLRWQEVISRDMQICIGMALITGFAAPFCGLFGIHLLRRERSSRRTHAQKIELMHAQRLAIMGDTSAMLAADINTALGEAEHRHSLLSRQLAAANTDGSGETVKQINEAFLQAGAVVKRLRRFIEKREAEKSLESAAALVDDAIALLGTIDRTLCLDTDIGDDVPLLKVDRIQLQQVLVNLLRNAIEAMQDGTGRQLTLKVRARARHTVEFALADTGPGLDPWIAGHLFEPFYSSKSPGRGVGLAISKDIITGHGGAIWAEANPGGGMVFRFTLPAAEDRAAA